MAEGWDKDAFPTSAKPVFRGWLLLSLLIGTLCFVTWYLSEHPDDAQQIGQDQRRERVREDFLADGQEQDDGTMGLSTEN